MAHQTSEEYVIIKYATKKGNVYDIPEEIIPSYNKKELIENLVKIAQEKGIDLKENINSLGEQITIYSVKTKNKLEEFTEDILEFLEN